MQTRHPSRVGILACVTLILAGALWHGPTIAAAQQDVSAANEGKRVYVEVFIRGERRDEKVAGQLIEHDADKLTLSTTTGTQRTVRFADLTPNSAYAFKLRFIDRTQSRQWLGLGQWAWDLGSDRHARMAFTQARTLEPELGPQIDEILRKPPSTRPADDRPSGDRPSGNRPGRGSRAVGAESPGRDDAGDDHGDDVAQRGTARERAVTEDGLVQQPVEAVGEIVKFQPATPEEHALAIAVAKRRAAAVGRLLRVNLATVETNHFLIFTDWDPAEHAWLSQQCEDAYRVVARNFDMDPEQNVFIGKLPVFMFRNQADFQAFATEFDEFAAPRAVLGYFVGRDDGNGHMAMWKPRVGSGVNAATNLADAERRWGRTLIHEFVHAFVSRYRTNQRIPRWLNEGVAEVIAEAVLPTPTYNAWARQMALHDQDISLVFADEIMPPGEYYPVMMTLVQMLVKEDRKAFIRFFNDIKDGMDPEQALVKHFKVGYAGLQLAWDRYASKLK